MRISGRCTVLSLLLLSACGEPAMMETDAGPPPPTGLPVLGSASHSIDAVQVQVVATFDDGLATPRDLAFNPEVPNQLWVVNRNTSVAVIDDLGLPTQQGELHAGFGTNHFLAQPAAIAFGAPGTFATAPEENEVTQATTPADFMGPTLWGTDPSIFDAGHASHLDMLHNSPSSAGIAWERDNVYWVFDGAHGSLTRYDFQSDHGPGGADHTDGVVSRYVEGQVAYVPRTPSHMEFLGGLLYVADSGNNRIAVLDPSTATEGLPISPNYDGTDQHAMEGGALTTLVDGSMIDRMERPSGMAIDGDHIFISDNATSTVFAFDLMTGELVDWLDVSSQIGDSSLMGITLDADGQLLLVDALAERILRIAPAPELPAGM